jgi:hypothetical protein
MPTADGLGHERQATGQPNRARFAPLPATKCARLDFALESRLPAYKNTGRRRPERPRVCCGPLEEGGWSRVFGRDH